MKIIKKSDTFESQIHPEENTEEMEKAESIEEINDTKLGKTGPTKTARVISQISNSLGTPIRSSWVASGSVGWFEVDGIIYEVNVSPAARGSHFEYFNELMNNSFDEDTSEDFLL